MEAKIFIGIPSNREDINFLVSINSFLTELRRHYDVTLSMVKWQSYPTALNRIIDLFLVSNCEYLLFLDDDHIGHSKAMLDALIKSEKDFIGMHTYCRKFPHFGLLIKENDGIFSSEEHKSGVHEIHVTGTSMLLVHKSVFSKLVRPFFGEHDVEKDKNCETDFCLRLRNVGVKMFGCWDFCLQHGEITKENVQEFRYKNAPSYIDRFLAHKNKG